MNDRIKLAEAMNLDVHADGESVARDAHKWDPFTDANDCHELIKHLNGLGWNISITHGRTGKAIIIFQQPRATKSYRDTYDNYMQGVCELALKVLSCPT